MKIAVASEGQTVTQHFGFCKNFNIFTIKEDKIVEVESVENPGHKPGFLPRYLHDMGVNVIISGGMGGNAVGLFNGNGIEVVIGATGEAEDNVKKYLRGELESTGSACEDHSH